MRHDPHPELLSRARAGMFRDALNVPYRLATGESMPADVYHDISFGLDEVFGDYENLRIACTSPAAKILVDRAKMTPREAEQVADLWLHHWRRGKTLNCPKEKK